MKWQYWVVMWVVLLGVTVDAYADAVTELIKILTSASSEYSELAAQALGEIKDPRAVAPLILALQDSNMLVRQSVAQALGEIKNRRAVTPLDDILYLPLFDDQNRPQKGDIERIEVSHWPADMSDANCLNSIYLHLSEFAYAATRPLNKIPIHLSKGTSISDSGRNIANSYFGGVVDDK